MNAKDAAYQALQDAGKPLHYKELTELILEKGYWTSDGETPWMTVNSLLAMDIKQKRDQSQFQRTQPGIFALREWDMTKYVPESSSSDENTLSFTDAAEYILEHHAKKQPMHYRELTDIALEEDLITTEGKTPEATMYAVILTEIQRRKKQGEVPRFVMHGNGFIGLRRWMGEGLAFQIERHNKAIRKKLHQQLMELAFDDFEGLIGRLLIALGFEDVTVTSRRGDGGIDVRGTLVVGDVIKTTMAVQVKRWKHNVQAPVVQQVRGSLGTHEQGLIITTSDYSSGAYAEAARADAIPVGLMNGEQLVKLLVEQDIGVERSSYDLLELKDLDSDDAME